MAIALPDAPSFAAVTRESAIRAGAVLGLSKAICERELNRLMATLPRALRDLIAAIETENGHYAEAVRPFLGGEIRLLRTVEHVVVPYMLERLS